MPGRNHILLVLITLVIPRILYPQQPADPTLHTEEILFRDETAEVPVEIYETLADLINDPLNLNTATPDQLSESALFTPYQVHMLVKYREKFGEIYSIYELASLSGFRISRLQEISAYLTVKSEVVSRSKKNNQHLVLISAGRTLPEANGYQSRSVDQKNPAYAGAPIKTSFRIKSHTGNNLSMGLSYEKDAGEKCFHGMRPEFLSGYICYRGNRLIKQLVVGNFRLHQGLGLVNGTGFMQSPEGYLKGRLPISKLIASSSLNEYRFENGIACQMDLKKVELLVWSSYREPDLSLSDLTVHQGSINWLEHQRKTGLHRTVNEVDGRSLAYRYYSGIQAVIHINNLNIGSTYGMEVSGLNKTGLDSLKAELNPYLHGTLSLQGQWHRDRLDLFGEGSLSRWNSTAMQLGLRYYFNDFLQGLLLFHHYGPTYRGIQPSSYASGSNICNEQGVALLLHAEPGTLFLADFSVELFNYPYPRYLTNVPCTGYRYSCTLKNTGTKNFQWKFRFVKKVWQTTPAINEIGPRSLRSTEITRLDFRFSHDPALLLKWQSRIIFSLLSGKSNLIPGYAAVQQVSMNLLKYLKCTFQFVVFYVPDWDNRIYLYEPGLYYSFNFPVYYGTGQKITSVVSLKAGNRITLAGRVSVITYNDRKETGSGNDLIPGNKKWELEMQLRLSF